LSETESPPGWDEERVRRILAHYEEQTEEEAVAEDEPGFQDPDHDGGSERDRPGGSRAYSQARNVDRRTDPGIENNVDQLCSSVLWNLPARINGSQDLGRNCIR
jgi:hypothetical protein